MCGALCADATLPCDSMSPCLTMCLAATNNSVKINKPTSGARTEKDLPVGEHPIQLYSMATPNGQKVTVALEEMGLKYDAWFTNIMEVKSHYAHTHAVQVFFDGCDVNCTVCGLLFMRDWVTCEVVSQQRSPPFICPVFFLSFIRWLFTVT